MKKLPVLLCVFLLSACAPSEVPSDKLVERNGIKYEINSQIPFTGVSAGYYENGQLKSKVTYKDGKEQGLFEAYRKNGQLWFKQNYKDGVDHGLSESYWEDGQLHLKQNHKDGVEHGLSESYYTDGRPSRPPACHQNGKKVDMSKCE